MSDTCDGCPVKDCDGRSCSTDYHESYTEPSVCRYGCTRDECLGDCFEDCPGEIRKLNEEFAREMDAKRWGS